MKTVVMFALSLLAAVFLFAVLSAVFGAIGIALNILMYVGGFALAMLFIAGFIGCAIQEFRAHFNSTKNS